jgi:hypothetical protein
MWERLGEQLVGLEGRLEEAASATAKQRGYVGRLREAAARGGSKAAQVR